MTEATGEGIAARMLPTVDDRNRHFWTGGAKGQLLLLRCADCRRWVHPPVDACPHCGSTSLAAEATSGRGTVFTFTVNHHRFNPAVPVPYVIALVELDDQPGLRLSTNIVNCDPSVVDVDMPVQVLFERHGEVFVPLFEPRPGGTAPG